MDPNHVTSGGSLEETEMWDDVNDTHITRISPLVPPACLMEDLPLSAAAHTTVMKGRKDLRAILDGADDRVVVIVGPCSIHDVAAGREYAQRLQGIAKELSGSLLVIMRVYFEKPRSTVGWKGLINDPDLDGSCRINKGLRLARELLLHINEMGLPCGGEFLDTVTPQFIADLFSWGAIGARTTESQLHRELSSGLSMPIGFKNGVDGSVSIAIDACIASRTSHHFLGVTKQGLAAIIRTSGNPQTHVILRGSSSGPNYSAAHVQDAAAKLREKKLCAKIMVDCSHGNSSKDHKRQPIVVEALCEQIAGGDTALFGAMVESNLVEGKQDIGNGKNLVYGKSVTDACVDFPTTELMLRKLAEAVQKKRQLEAFLRREGESAKGG